MKKSDKDILAVCIMIGIVLPLFDLIDYSIRAFGLDDLLNAETVYGINQILLEGVMEESIPRKAPISFFINSVICVFVAIKIYKKSKIVYKLTKFVSGLYIFGAALSLFISLFTPLFYVSIYNFFQVVFILGISIAIFVLLNRNKNEFLTSKKLIEKSINKS
ncbi:MAG: hypothetical protein PHW96_02170 [Candidatus Nanoarchaeia archaeon]|nr:hypothetical protein [Candidatus Nanoarchaeia archaeon]